MDTGCVFLALGAVLLYVIKMTVTCYSLCKKGNPYGQLGSGTVFCKCCGFLLPVFFEQ